MEDALQLESGAPLSQKQAAARYEVDPRTMKRWVAKGREIGKPCPFADPRGIIEWWPFKVPVPEKIRELAGDSAPPVAPAAPLKLAEFRQAGGGFSAALQTAQALVQAEERLLEEALASGDEKAKTLARERWFEAIEMLRRLERDAGKIEAQQGSTVRVADVRTAIQEAHAMIPARFRAELASAMRQLPGHGLAGGDLDRWVRDVVNRACAALCEFDLMPAMPARAA